MKTASSRVSLRLAMFRQAFLALVLALPMVPLAAQTMPDPGRLFAWNDQAAPALCLKHYRLGAGATISHKAASVDYWVWQAASDRMETLYDAAALGRGDEAVWLDQWKLSPVDWQFALHSRRNLRPAPGKADTSQTAWFDLSSKVLRTQISTLDKDKVRRTSLVEDMPWAPMLWQRDLGAYFIAFFPHLAADAPAFTLCMESSYHLVWLQVRLVGEELANGIPCRKYSLEGLGLWSGLVHGGAVWISADSQSRLVRLEQRIALAWTLPLITLDLVETTIASPDEWLALRDQI